MEGRNSEEKLITSLQESEKDQSEKTRREGKWREKVIRKSGDKLEIWKTKKNNGEERKYDKEWETRGKVQRIKVPKIADSKETKRREAMKMTNRKKEEQANGPQRKNGQ